MRNNKGLSSVVTTLIVVLLALVAIAIVWGVVNKMLSSGVSKTDIATKCLGVDVKVTNVSAPSPTTLNVIVERQAGTGSDAIVGVQLVSSLGGTSKVSATQLGDIKPLESKTLTAVASGFTAKPSSVAVSAVFKDDTGKEQACAPSAALALA